MKTKSILSIFVLVTVSVFFKGCQTGGAPAYELALITDMGTIHDKSFNQGSWEGLKAYGEENNILYKYYKPVEQSDDIYLASIEQAVKGGAKLIVTPGFLFETPVYKAQEIYPEVSFILVDGEPHDENYNNFNTSANTVAVLYAEEQAGFLAGYAAVNDGYRSLGFIGGMDLPPVVRFGYGFVQGADYAAEELGLGVESIRINYHYTGEFKATPEAEAMAASWYDDGIEVIFACGGEVGDSVMAAAEEAGGLVIGVDVDQSGESETVITSAMKGLRESVYSCVKAYYDGTFPGMQTLVFGADNNGVGLPMETSRFKTFSQEDYDAIFSKIADGNIMIIGDVISSVTHLPLRTTLITEVR